MVAIVAATAIVRPECVHPSRGCAIVMAAQSEALSQKAPMADQVLRPGVAALHAVAFVPAYFRYRIHPYPLLRHPMAYDTYHPGLFGPNQSNRLVLAMSGLSVVVRNHPGGYYQEPHPVVAKELLRVPAAAVPDNGLGHYRSDYHNRHYPVCWPKAPDTFRCGSIAPAKVN